MPFSPINAIFCIYAFQPKRCNSKLHTIQLRCFSFYLQITLNFLMNSTKYTQQTKKTNTENHSNRKLNLHCQSHSQQPEMKLSTWLRLSNEKELWYTNLTSIPIWFWGYWEREREREREVLKVLGEIKRNCLRYQCFSIVR